MDDASHLEGEEQDGEDGAGGDVSADTRRTKPLSNALAATARDDRPERPVPLVHARATRPSRQARSSRPSAVRFVGSASDPSTAIAFLTMQAPLFW